MRKKWLALMLAAALAAGSAGCAEQIETVLPTEAVPTETAQEVEAVGITVEAQNQNIHHRDTIEEKIVLKVIDAPEGFALTSADISLSGGFDNMQLTSVVATQTDEYTLVIKGDTSEMFDAGIIDIKAADSIVSVPVYFVEEPHLWERGAVYAHNNAPQTMDIGVQYGTFSETIGEAQITLGDGFSGAEIQNVQYVDDTHIAVTLTSLDITAQTGMVTISADGFADEFGYNEDLSVGIAIVPANVTVLPRMLIYEENLNQTYQFALTFPDDSYQSVVSTDSIALTGVLEGLEISEAAFTDTRTLVITGSGEINGVGMGGISSDMFNANIDVEEERYVFGIAMTDVPLSDMTVSFQDADGNAVTSFETVSTDESGEIFAHIASHAQIPSVFRMVVNGTADGQAVTLMAQYEHFCPAGGNLNANILTTLVCMVMDNEGVSYTEAEQKVLEYAQIENTFFNVTDDVMSVGDFDAQEFEKQASGEMNDYLAQVTQQIKQGDTQSFATQITVPPTTQSELLAGPLVTKPYAFTVGTLSAKPQNSLNVITLSASSYALDLLKPAIKEGVKGLAGAIGHKAAEMAFNWVLESIGISTGPDTQDVIKELKKVEGMLSGIKSQIADVQSQMSKEIEMSTFQTRSSTLTDDISKINNAYDTYQRICKATDPTLRASLKKQLMGDIESYNMPLILEHINEELTSDSGGKVPLLKNYWDYLLDAHPFQHQSTPAMTNVYNDYVGIQSKALMLYTEYCHAKAADITNPNDVDMNNAANAHDKFMTSIEAQAKYVKSDKASSYIKYYKANHDDAFVFLIVNKNGSKWSLMKEAVNHKFGYKYYGYVPDCDEDNDYFMGPRLVTSSSQRNSSSTKKTLELFVAGASGSTKIGSFLKANDIYPSGAKNSTIWLYVGFDNEKGGDTYGLKTSRECSDIHVDYITAHDGNTHSLADLYHN